MYFISEMVRNFISQNLRGKWSVDVMKEAVQAVVNGMNLKSAAREFSVPRNTLRRKVDAQNNGLDVQRVIGKKTVLNVNEEQQLVDLLINMENHLFGLSMQDLRRLVFQFCEKNKIVHPFNKTAEMAGIDWARSFMNRHHNLSIRKPQAMSIARAIGFNREKVNRFFTALQGVIFDREELIIPDENVYNVDETGLTVCQMPQKIIAQKGKKSVSTLTSAERGKTVTIICCVSGVGVFVPPMMIFPRVRMREELIDKAPNGTVGAATKSGWVNEDAFVKWFDHFLVQVQPKARDRPVLLIMDGHSSHTKSLTLIEKARDSNVVLLSLPSHCTHRLQPLDVSFFKSLKNYYNKEVQCWLRRHPGRPVTEFQIAELFSIAYGHAASVGNGVSGFRKCGIIPFSPNIFTDDDFSAAEVTYRDYPNIPAVQGETQSETVPASTDVTSSRLSAASVPPANRSTPASASCPPSTSQNPPAKRSASASTSCQPPTSKDPPAKRQAPMSKDPPAKRQAPTSKDPAAKRQAPTSKDPPAKCPPSTSQGPPVKRSASASTSCQPPTSKGPIFVNRQPFRLNILLDELITYKLKPNVLHGYKLIFIYA